MILLLFFSFTEKIPDKIPAPTANIAIKISMVIVSPIDFVKYTLINDC